MEPNTEYIVSYEVLRDDLASNSEYEVSVEVGGYDFGSCQGGGGDYDCNFVSCGSSGTTSIQSDENGDIYVKTSFTGNSYDCDCNRADVSVDCVKERYVIIHNHISTVCCPITHTYATLKTQNRKRRRRYLDSDEGSITFHFAKSQSDRVHVQYCRCKRC